MSSLRVSATWWLPLLVVLAGAGSARANVYTYDNTTSGTIPNASSDTNCNNNNLALLRTFTVAETFDVQTVAVGLTIDHNRRGDVRARLIAPNGTAILLFDNSGNLWVSFATSNVIARLTPADREGTGEKVVTPEVQVVLPVSALLGGIAWDEEGHLWSPFRAGQLARISPAQLSSGGDVTPAATVDNADLGSASSWLAAYPAPAGLPVYHSLP